MTIEMSLPPLAVDTEVRCAAPTAAGEASTSKAASAAMAEHCFHEYERILQREEEPELVVQIPAGQATYTLHCLKAQSISGLRVSLQRVAIQQHLKVGPRLKSCYSVT